MITERIVPQNSFKILVVAHRRALEVDGVIDLLRAWGVQIIRWNVCQYPEYQRVSVHWRAPGRASFVSCDETLIHAGWVHELGFFSVARSLTGLAREVALRDCSTFLEGVLVGMNCTWLNGPRAISLASNKIYQLITAQRLGIPVPPYIVTNDPDEVRRFNSTYKSLVAKSLGVGFLVYGSQLLKFYTRRLARLGKNLKNALQYGPLIFQQEIERECEIRVTVVDNQCFSLRVDCQNLPSDIVDIRQLDFNQNRERFGPPTNVETLETWSRLIVRELGLSYAGIDWAISLTGKIYFLECNPLGSFKWSEICGGFKIAEAIAVALYERVIQAQQISVHVNSEHP